jgi:hypothetical protein
MAAKAENKRLTPAAITCALNPMADSLWLLSGFFKKKSLFRSSQNNFVQD